MIKTRDIAVLLHNLGEDSEENPCVACQFVNSLDEDRTCAAHIEEYSEAEEIDLSSEKPLVRNAIQIPLQTPLRDSS